MTGRPDPVFKGLDNIVKTMSARPAIPPEYFCPECHWLKDVNDPTAIEWFEANRPDLYPLTPLWDCHCKLVVDQEERSRQRKIANINLPKRARTGPRTFENFNATFKGAREMLDIVQRWAAGELPESYLTLIGITGSGKTHLLEAAVAHLNARGVSARYDRAEDVLNTLRATFRHSEDEQDIQDVMHWYDQFDALVIDDLGANRPSEWGVGYIYLMMDKRYADGRMLAIGTNIRSAKEMEKAWDARIASRCFDRNSGIVKVLWSEAADYRKANL